jgi:hypothetical protein
MASIDPIVREIAVPLTGFLITSDEAKKAYDKLISLSDQEFAAACRELSRHAFGTERKRNKIKDLLNNLSSQKNDRIIQRMLDVSVPIVLGRMPKTQATPYAVFVIMLHGRLREMGMGKQGALRVLDEAIPNGKFDRSIHRDYVARFGTDNLGGWDKAMHFTKAAWLAYTSVEAAVIASYGKEVYDQAQHWMGHDPEGWSNADIDADILGIGWGMNLRSQP